MRKPLNFTDEQRVEAARRIEHGFAFAREVLADPTILDQIPNGSEVIAIPKTERVPERSYDVETPNMVAIVRTPVPTEAKAEPAAPVAD